MIRICMYSYVVVEPPADNKAYKVIYVTSAHPAHQTMIIYSYLYTTLPMANEPVDSVLSTGHNQRRSWSGCEWQADLGLGWVQRSLSQSAAQTTVCTHVPSYHINEHGNMIITEPSTTCENNNMALVFTRGIKGTILDAPLCCITI